MTLMRWRPMRQLATIQEEINRAFDDFFGRFPIRDDFFGTGWSPVVDIRETDDEIIVEAELPGVDQNDVKVSLNDGVLTIRGEKKQEKETEKDNYHRVERCYGAFQRSFTLPTAVKADQTKAKFKNGILTVTIPKAEQAKPKEIAVEVES